MKLYIKREKIEKNIDLKVGLNVKIENRDVET